MREYAIGVFAVCLVFGVLMRLSWGSGDMARLAVAIITAYVIVTPAVSALNELDISELFEKIEPSSIEGSAEYEKTAEAAFEKGIKKALTEKFSLDESCTQVLCRDFNFENMRAGQIKVILSGRAAVSDYRKIENYLNELNIGECSVEIKIG